MDEFDQETKLFLQNDCKNIFSIHDLKQAIQDIGIKNLTKSRIPKTTIQTYAYVYQVNLTLKQLQQQIYLEIFTF